MIRERDAWATVLSTFGTPERPRSCDGEPLWASQRRWRSFDLRMPNNPTLLLLSPKRSLLQWWGLNRILPHYVAIICTPWLADPGAGPVLQPLYRHVPAAVFLGDLDPISIAQYLEATRLARALRARLRYGGINDAWLAAMKRSLKRQRRRVSLLLPLSRPEVMLLKRLDVAIDLEQLVGPEASSMLRGGYKVEIEGAINPAFHRPEYDRWIFRHLRSVARQPAEGREQASGPANE